MKVAVYSKGNLISGAADDNINKVVVRSGCGKCVVYQDNTGSIVLGFKHQVYSRIKDKSVININRKVR